MHHAPRFLAFADLPYRFTWVTCKLSVPRMLSRSFSLVFATNSAREVSPPLRIFHSLLLHCSRGNLFALLSNICLVNKNYEYFTFWILYVLSGVEISWVSWCKSSRWRLFEEINDVCSWLSNVSVKKFENWRFKNSKCEYRCPLLSNEYSLGFCTLVWYLSIELQSTNDHDDIDCWKETIHSP